MNNEPMTSMGPVIIKVEMNFIYLSTQDPHYPEMTLNIWDHKAGKMKDLGGSKGLLETVIDTLDSTFDNFEFYGIVGEDDLDNEEVLA
jgi:hypothetical protein